MVTYSIPDFSPQCAKAVNNQIHMSMSVMYYYMAMAAHFQSFTVALPGMYKFSASAADRHLKQVRSVIKYQNKRGGTAKLPDLPSPSDTSFGNALKSMEIAQSYEKVIYSELLNVHETASSYKDYEMVELAQKMLSTQLRVIKYIGDFITQLDRVGTGYGEFYFDYEFETQVEEDKNKFA